ncbi:MAG: HIT family protein [Nanoarchaeota archaeon]|nr:HIT family protein [Nanoarchaeota archaeon]
MAQQQMSEEQLKEIQEKIKNMSPEELKEFQKKQCIFCQIISGKVQSRKIYEDDKCLAILDINPSNPGHILLLPKEHYSIMPQVPEEEIAHLFIIAKTVSNAALRSLGIQGTNIIVQNGIAAGQKAQHFMIHVIPRKEGDGINFELPKKKMSEDDLESIKQKLESKLGHIEEKKQKSEETPQLISPKKELDADFTFEVPKEEPDEQIEQPKKEKTTKKKKIKLEKAVKPKNPSKKESKSSSKSKSSQEVSLDDIARVIGGR